MARLNLITMKYEADDYRDFDNMACSGELAEVSFFNRLIYPIRLLIITLQTLYALPGKIIHIDETIKDIKMNRKVKKEIREEVKQKKAADKKRETEWKAYCKEREKEPFITKIELDIFHPYSQLRQVRYRGESMSMGTRIVSVVDVYNYDKIIVSVSRNKWPLENRETITPRLYFLNTVEKPEEILVADFDSFEEFAEFEKSELNKTHIDFENSKFRWPKKLKFNAEYIDYSLLENSEETVIYKYSKDDDKEIFEQGRIDLEESMKEEEKQKVKSLFKKRL